MAKLAKFRGKVAQTGGNTAARPGVSTDSVAFTLLAGHRLLSSLIQILAECQEEVGGVNFELESLL